MHISQQLSFFLLPTLSKDSLPRPETVQHSCGVASAYDPRTLQPPCQGENGCQRLVWITMTLSEISRVVTRSTGSAGTERGRSAAADGCDCHSPPW